MTRACAPGPDEGRCEVTVTVADAALDSLEDVVNGLSSAGMQVDRVLGGLGVVTGTVATGALPALEAVSGVAGVARAQAFRLAPPDAEVQ